MIVVSPCPLPLQRSKALEHGQGKGLCIGAGVHLLYNTRAEASR
jgi:hypothetical protein